MEEYVCPSGGVLLKCGDTFFKATVLLVRHGRDEIVVTQQDRSFKVTRNGRYINYIKD